MTATERWIKDAIDGGYKTDVIWYTDKYIEKDALASILLDPTFWQAVGKTRGWEYKLNGGGKMIIDNYNPKERKEIAKEWGIKPDWQVYWYTFIDHLADGLTIEEALSVIEK